MESVSKADGTRAVQRFGVMLCTWKDLDHLLPFQANHALLVNASDK